MSKIVVSYRRKDSPGMVRAIFDRLERHYGKDSVFMDVDIPYGSDFRKHIDEVLRGCDVLVAVIGPRWLGPRDQGSFRIKDDNDWVRLEVETSMRSGVTVIPVLVDGAAMPDARHLPAGLGNFPYLNAAIVDVGRDFPAHMAALIRRIDQLLGIADGPAADGHAADRDASVAQPDRTAATIERLQSNGERSGKSPPSVFFGVTFLLLAGISAWITYALISDANVSRFVSFAFSALFLSFLFVGVQILVRHVKARMRR